MSVSVIGGRGIGATQRAREALRPLPPAVLVAGTLSAVPGMLCFAALLAGVPPASPLLLLFPGATAALLLASAAGALRCGPLERAGGRAVVAAAAVFLLLQVPWLLLPPVARDELVYHLAVPSRWVREGGPVDLPFMRYAYYPMLLQGQFVPLLARGWIWAPRLLHLLYGGAWFALAFGALGHRRCGPALALALLTAPAAGALLGTAYVDLALAWYVALAVVAWWPWADRQDGAALAIAAFSAGAGGAVKHSGFLFAAWLALLVVLTSRRPARDAALFLALAAVPALPWLARNAVLTGNPFHPLLAGVLGWRPAPEGSAVDEIVRRRLLYGESWIEVVLVPVRVFLTGLEGSPRRFDGVLTPLGLLAVLALPVDRDPRVRRLLLFAAGSLVSAFLLASRSEAAFQARFVLPACFPLLSLAAVPLDAWLGGPGRRRAAAAAVLAATFAFHAAHAVHHWRRWRPLSVLTGGVSAAAYIERFAPEYPLAAWAAEHLPADSVVYLGFLGSRGYFWRQRYLYDDNYLAPTLRDAVRNATDAAGVARALRARGIDVLVLAERPLHRYLRDNLEPHERLRWEAFAGGYLQPLRRHRGITVYRLLPGGGAAAGAPGRIGSARAGVPCTAGRVAGMGGSWACVPRRRNPR